MILRYNVTRGDYTTMQTPCLEGPDNNMGIVHRVLQQDYPKLRLLLETFRSVKTPREVRNCWYPEVVAQAQRDDPDISVVLCRLLKEWRKPAVEELHVDALCCSCCLGPV